MLISEFGKVNNIKNEITLYLVDDQLQESTSDMCDMFQLYFYKNLFDPLHNFEIINDNKLTNNTVLKLLNKIFSLNRQENEAKVEKFAAEHSITRE